MSISITKKEDGAHESEIDELCKAEDKYFHDFLKALLRVDNRYIMWGYDYQEDKGKKGITMVERIFAYELYHQFRTIMDNKESYKGIFLNGETKKDDSIYSMLYKKICYPDLVLHKDPGSVDPSGQYLLCEIKTAKNSNLFKDLQKLKKLEECGLNFKYYIFLLVLGNFDDIKTNIKNKIKSLSSISKNTVCVTFSGNTIEYCRLEELTNELNK